MYNTVMSIEVEQLENPTHEENIIYRVFCYNCPDLSEEDGDYKGPVAELSPGLGVTIQAALDIAINHDQFYIKRYNQDHVIKLEPIDIGKIRDALSSLED